MKDAGLLPGPWGVLSPQHKQGCQGFGSQVWGYPMCVLSWCPWPWRIYKESSEPDRTVGGRDRAAPQPQGKMPGYKKKVGAGMRVCSELETSGLLSRFRELWASWGLIIHGNRWSFKNHKVERSKGAVGGNLTAWSG